MAPTQSPARTVVCADALDWLARQPMLAGCAVVTSLPDASEVGLGREAWREWFDRAAKRVFEKVPDESAAIFFQTDVKRAGGWTDKAHLVISAAEEAGSRLLWHKVVCRVAPGEVSYGVAGYSHLLCFSRSIQADPHLDGPDVLPSAGAMTWVRAMGLSACGFACRWILARTPCRTVVDPFCGQGTALAVANALGMDAVGVELNRKRASLARKLEVGPGQLE